MTLFAHRAVAVPAARALQVLTRLAEGPRARERAKRFPEKTCARSELAIPTSVGPAPAVVYRPHDAPPAPPVHVNFHGGGFVFALYEDDDPLCRYLAATTGRVVVNVDYVVAPQHPFPAPTTQAYEVVRWVAGHGPAQGWDGRRLTVGGQSAGAALAAAAARQALTRGGPEIALQVLHYPPLDLVTPAADKPTTAAKPVLRPWMTDLFHACYVPEAAMLRDPLVSPATPGDTADLTGIAPALILTPEHDRLRAEGERYARRLAAVGALREHVVVPGADHGYDLFGDPQAEVTCALIADHLVAATGDEASRR